MQKLLCISALLGLLLAISSVQAKSIVQEQKVSYKNYKVYTITLKSKDEANQLEKFKSTLPSVDTWKEPTPTLESKQSKSTSNSNVEYFTNIMIPSESQSLLEDFLTLNNFPFSIMIEDVGSLVEEQEQENNLARTLNAGTKAVTWDAYYKFPEVMAWLDEIVGNNSDIASSRVIGKSTEGRELKLVKISKKGSPANKNAILIDGGFHAREWISPAVATYILDQLLNNRDANKEVLDAVDVYIIPFINPDGYAYTQTDRMWRKTRSDHDSPSGCRGVDPNRNFDFHFGGPGTSSNKCSEIYTGPKAFSEPETSALRDVLLNKNAEVKWRSYLTLHSYGQWWLTPWSFSYDLPEDYDDLMRFANKGVGALQGIHNTKYVAGATTEILGLTAGCADDWAKAEAGVKYANTIEMRDTGRYGFLLPATQIKATAEETWAGIRAVTLFDFDADDRK